MDKQRIGAFAEHVYRDMAGAMAIGMGYIGVKAGLFEALADGEPVTAEELAKKTGLVERYVLEWLRGMTAAEWLEFDADAATYRMPPEHGFLLASDGSDHYMGGLLIGGPALVSLAPRLSQAFRQGGGIAFDGSQADWIEAMDLMNGGPYVHRLASYWMGQVPDAAEALVAGGRALDLGCGVGRVSIALAGAYPKAEIVAVEPDKSSIEQAERNAGEAGAGNIRFINGKIEDVSVDEKFDFAALFDCLHDLTEPVRTVADIRARMKPEGVLMVMEPRAADGLEDNINPLGAFYYGFSIFHCMTHSLAQGGPGLGTCLGPAQTMELLKEGGFSRVEQLPIKSQTNMFFAARP